MKPEFTETEKFIIAHAKSEESSSGLSAIYPDLLCVIFSIILMGLAFWLGDPTWMLVGIIILVWHILKNALATKKYTPFYRSIFQKYDAAIENLMKDKD